MTNPEANIEEIHPDRKSSSAAIANTRRAGIQYSSAQYIIKADIQAQNCADENGYDKTQYIQERFIRQLLKKILSRQLSFQPIKMQKFI